jgi:triosephosphate isomerase (TIM)
MRTPLIAGNWKMHTTPTEAAVWVRSLLEDLTADDTAQAVSGCELLLAIPATHLSVLASIIRDTPIGLGAQDVSEHAEGAYTGEVSAAMLADVGARYVVIGHSERRAYHHEDDVVVARKVTAARSAGLVPIVCVGEVEAQRDASEHERVVLQQLEGALGMLDLARGDALVVAYEPVWAIGTGRTATAADAQAMGAVVRSFLKGRFGPVADEVRILYGGSMKPGNAGELLAQPDVDGGLIGGASLDRDAYLAIARAARQ